MIRDILAPNPGPFTLYGTRTWLIGSHLMIDPGPLIESHVEALLEAQPEVSDILITHRHADHAPAARPIAQRTGARIWAPRGVLDDSSVHGRLDDGSEIVSEGMTIRAVATPGHTAEHVCFITSEGDLFTGDMILGEGTSAIFPPDGDMGAYLASLSKLRALAPRRIYPAHGPVREDPIEWIDHYISHRHTRETQVAAAVREGERSLGELRSVVYPDLDPALHGAAEGQLRAHLAHMVEDGRISWDGRIARDNKF